MLSFLDVNIPVNIHICFNFFDVTILLYFNVMIFGCEHFYNFMLSLLDGIILGIIFVTVFVFLAPLHFILVENVIHSFFGCAYLPTCILREDKTCSVS